LEKTVKFIFSILTYLLINSLIQATPESRPSDFEYLFNHFTGKPKAIVNTRFECKKDFILEFIKWTAERKLEGRFILENVCDHLHNDFDTVFSAVKLNGHNYFYASEELQSNEEIALEALKTFLAAFDGLPQDLRKSRVFFLKAVKINPKAMIVADNSLKKDAKFILELIKINSKTLKFADSSLTDNHNFLFDTVIVSQDDDIFMIRKGHYKDNDQFINDEYMIRAALKGELSEIERIFLKERGNLKVLIERLKHFSKETQDFIIKLKNDQPWKYNLNKFFANY